MRVEVEVNDIAQFHFNFFLIKLSEGLSAPLVCSLVFNLTYLAAFGGKVLFSSCFFLLLLLLLLLLLATLLRLITSTFLD